jgi:hypothetical protein
VETKGQDAPWSDPTDAQQLRQIVTDYRAGEITEAEAREYAANAHVVFAGEHKDNGIEDFLSLVEFAADLLETAGGNA